MYYKKLKECLAENYFNVMPKKIDVYYVFNPLKGNTCHVDFCFNSGEFPIDGKFDLVIKDKEKAILKFMTYGTITKSDLLKAFSFFKIDNVEEKAKEILDKKNNFPDCLLSFSFELEIKHNEEGYHKLRKMIFTQLLKEYILSKKNIIISNNVANNIYHYCANLFFEGFSTPREFYESLNLNDFKFESKKDFITCVVYRINETEYLEYLELNYGR
jgi:hypothetical protein